MEERKFVKLKKDEFEIKEFVKAHLGKGRISRLDIEYTPVGEKVVISTSKPGLIIGRGGERITMLTETLRKKFKFENPHIEIKEITSPYLDAQTVAEEIAMNIEKSGPLRFKLIAYKMLQQIMNAGAKGVELKISGRLPSERARTWRFTKGYLKKVGDSAKVVDKAQVVAETKVGSVGISVSILHPDAKIHDQIDYAKLGMKEANVQNGKV
ncbi:30S ribosomal protein S3 [Candidatus Pacearchaeota archaeon]|uniref:30S ribosomal protein S3 n=1 Tax=uncultured organism TaxID=155900 RepID=U3GQY6_9ZZZZ|nr:30S ribosomal protein S3 [uncultured organism]AJS12628.1 30S ribosomal protein S3 [uncultured archaeon]MBS3099950.1 30S ribosomal protein S3 [Candidatus Pacearchaeota archaeon]